MSTARTNHLPILLKWYGHWLQLPETGCQFKARIPIESPALQRLKSGPSKCAHRARDKMVREVIRPGRHMAFRPLLNRRAFSIWSKQIVTQDSFANVQYNVEPNSRWDAQSHARIHARHCESISLLLTLAQLPLEVQMCCYPVNPILLLRRSRIALSVSIALRQITFLNNATKSLSWISNTFFSYTALSSFAASFAASHDNCDDSTTLGLINW